MENTVECATYVIDLTQAMLEYRQGLSDEQYEHIITINRRAVEFITSLIHNQSMSLDKFASYLNHDAMSPLTIVIGYSEVLLAGMCGDLPSDYREAIEQVRDCGQMLREDIQEMHTALRELL